MGDDCRTTGERRKQFAMAVATVRSSLQHGRGQANSPLPSATPAQLITKLRGVPVGQLDRFAATEGFWERYQVACAKEDANRSGVDQSHDEQVTQARIAALMQVLGAEAVPVRMGLVKFLSAASHVEATRALARFAIFSSEDVVQQAAVNALKVRRERDYTDIILMGLRYPWPAMARRAGEALVKLERTDLTPRLVEILDERDPRAPVLQKIDGKSVPVVRELVRVNHHRNCLLCHSPANSGDVPAGTLTAPVPLSTDPLQTPSEGYQNSAPEAPDLQVRVDVTYLRQDFSVFQPVAAAQRGPDMQRFDFLVRTRVLTEEEADVYRQNVRDE